MQKVNDDVEVAILKKNNTEQFRVTVGTYMGHKTVRLWVWFLGQDGEYRPGKHGVAFSASKLDEVIEVLGKARTADVVKFPARPEAR